MSAKIYQMNRPRWKTIGTPATHFAYREVEVPYAGLVSLTVIAGMERPLVVPSPTGMRTAIGNGFHWVQIAPYDGAWWLTAMFDDKQQLVQFYFDIAFSKEFRENGESCFRDAYIDVIMEPDGSIRIVDADELDAACAAGEITAEMCAYAKRAAADVAREFGGKARELERLSRGYLEELLQK